MGEDEVEKEGEEEKEAVEEKNAEMDDEIQRVDGEGFVREFSEGVEEKVQQEDKTPEELRIMRLFDLKDLGGGGDGREGFKFTSVADRAEEWRGEGEDWSRVDGDKLFETEMKVEKYDVRIIEMCLRDLGIQDMNDDEIYMKWGGIGWEQRLEILQKKEISFLESNLKDLVDLQNGGYGGKLGRLVRQALIPANARTTKKARKQGTSQLKQTDNVAVAGMQSGAFSQHSGMSNISGIAAGARNIDQSLEYMDARHLLCDLRARLRRNKVQQMAMEALGKTRRSYIPGQNATTVPIANTEKAPPLVQNRLYAATHTAPPIHHLQQRLSVQSPPSAAVSNQGNAASSGRERVAHAHTVTADVVSDEVGAASAVHEQQPTATIGLVTLKESDRDINGYQAVAARKGRLTLARPTSVQQKVVTDEERALSNAKRSLKFFYNGIELKRPVCLDGNCLWIRATNTPRTLVLKCHSAASAQAWLIRLTQSSDNSSQSSMEKQYTEASRLERVAHMDQATQARIRKLEDSLHHLEHAVTTAQKEHILGSKGVSKYQDPLSAGMVASAAHFSQNMFELRTKSKVQAVAGGDGPVQERKDRIEDLLRLHLNVVTIDLKWKVLETILSLLPTISIIAFVCTALLHDVDLAAVALFGLLLTLGTPWVKIAAARQRVERTHLLGKRMNFNGTVLNKDSTRAFWRLWFGNWVCSILTCGLSRIVSDSDFQEAAWLDQHVLWADGTISTVGIVLAVEYRAPAGEVKCVIAGGVAATAGTVSKGDKLIRVDGHSVESTTVRTHLHGTGWNEGSMGMTSKAVGGSQCSLASVKGNDMLIEPFAMTGDILAFDLVRKKVSFNLFRGQLQLFWSGCWCWLACFLSLGLLEPWVYIKYQRRAHAAQHLHLGGFTFNFSAKVSDYIKNVWIENLAFNVFSLGLWSILGFASARSSAWTDSKVELCEHTDSSHITGTLAALTRLPQGEKPMKRS